MSDETPTFRTLDQVVEHYRQAAQIPGLSVGTLIDGDFRASGYGVVSLANGYPARADTLYQIGSNTKVMTATVVMQMVEQNLLSLDTPIVEYLPDLELSDKAAAEQINMRHLLTHTSGLDGDIFEDTGVGDDALEKMIARAPQWRQETRPGEEWSYCNSGFYLAGRVMERLLGQTYEASMNERLFAKLGMERAFWFATDAIMHSVAAGHQQLPGQQEPTVARPWAIPRNANAAGGVIADVESVLKFVEFHMSGGKSAEGLLSHGSAAAMQAPQRKVTSQVEWGLGWTLGTVAGERVLYHGGTTNGQTSQMYAVPSKRFAIAILTNSGKGPDVIVPIIDWALERYCGLVREKKQPIELPAADLERYTGTYRRAISTIVVAVEDGKLKLDTVINHPLTHEEITLPPARFAPLGDGEFIGADEDNADDAVQFVGDQGGHPKFIRAGYRLVPRT